MKCSLILFLFSSEEEVKKRSAFKTQPLWFLLNIDTPFFSIQYVTRKTLDKLNLVKIISAKKQFMNWAAPLTSDSSESSAQQWGWSIFTDRKRKWQTETVLLVRAGFLPYLDMSKQFTACDWLQVWLVWLAETQLLITSCYLS